MDPTDRPRRENILPLAEIESLVLRVLGAPIPDRFVSWLGVSRRNADRWLDGSSTYPPAVIEKMQVLAPLCSEMLDDLHDLVEDYKRLGIPENLIRMRMREFSKTLSDEPPPKPGAPEPDKSA
ncbi:hypothetical protein [Aureimonas glaciei]|uniref:Uncharacterized protein n=1 Tax=Aureimonas glaciei TaxID=1776957 RepID=A0A917D8F7_9HYPH|nr:hypothetical protein [Aureimonas glaciei]GGD11969.1 hypothetical protein GCM10011335_13630 [Aureimonas glaciei]